MLSLWEQAISVMLHKLYITLKLAAVMQHHGQFPWTKRTVGCGARMPESPSDLFNYSRWAQTHDKRWSQEVSKCTTACVIVCLNKELTQGGWTDAELLICGGVLPDNSVHSCVLTDTAQWVLTLCTLWVIRGHVNSAEMGRPNVSGDVAITSSLFFPFPCLA